MTLPRAMPLPNAPALSWDDHLLLVASITDYAIFLLDPEGHVVTWNLGAERIKGYAEHEIIGQHFSKFYPPEDIIKRKPQRELIEARELGRVEDEGWRVRKDGTQFWANVVITAIKDGSGRLRGFGKVTRDLTERKATEERLRQSEDRFRLLVEGVADYAIYMLSPDGRIRTWNRGAERMKGYQASEVIGEHFSLFFPEPDVRAQKPDRELALALAEGRFEDEGWRVRKDGSRFWANVVVTPLRSKHGELLGFAKVTRDLTERRHAEEMSRALLREQVAHATARELAVRAEEANRIKDEFLATVSHELRTPLNAIVGWSKLLRERELEPGVAKGVEVIERNALTQARIVEDILDASRIITGKLRLDPQPTDFTAIVSQALDVVRHAAIAKRITLEFDPGSEPCLLLADPERLQQVVWNLLSNAVKFTPTAGSIWVTLRHSGSNIDLTVRDNGVGIVADLQPYVFERFMQADASTTRRFGGLGLGLALVKHIVELHGGTVSAASAGTGLGATFCVSLPVRASASPPGAGSRDETTLPSNDRTRGDLDGLRLLVVDDDPDANELMVALLSDAGATVESAHSAPEAFDVLRRFHPHILVSDIGMPGEDGYSLIRRVRALGPDGGGSIPAVALTAYTRREDRAKALEAGFTVHIGKPVNPSDLVATLAGLVQR